MALARERGRGGTGLAAAAVASAAGDVHTPPLTLTREYHAVAANLARRRDWTTKLRSAGHDPSTRTVWVLEGLLYYLSQADADATLRACAALSGASFSFFFHAGPHATASARRASILEDVSSLPARLVSPPGRVPGPSPAGFNPDARASLDASRRRV
jgi:hypothetical protein